MMENYNRSKLMLASFLTLVASGVGFATRAAAGGVWEKAFGIDGGQFGQIMGAGFLGFGLMIFFGGILVEKFGYKTLLTLAFFLHLASAVMLLVAPGLFEGWQEADAATATNNAFALLWWSALLFSLCQGLYEAVINPLVAQLYPENKTHYLNILHAGWPGGMILGGLFAAGFIGRDAWFAEIPWQYALSTFAVFVFAYGVLALPEKMPPTAATVAGDFGRVFSCFASWPFLLLLVLHALIGYMELGVDSWVTKLMENLLPNAVVILVYTSLLMFVLRFFAGPIVHRINPIGLLLISSIIACVGLLWLGSDIQTLAMVFAAATVYSFGKAFLWPTMLAVAGERYPYSGAVAMGALGAAGMLTVGQIGGPAIGHKQGYNMSAILAEKAPETFDRYAAADPTTYAGFEYRPIIAERLNAANGIRFDENGTIDDASSLDDAGLLDSDEKSMLREHIVEDAPAIQDAYLRGGRKALTLTAYVPAAMTVGFLILFIYYRLQGGYKPIEIEGVSSAH